MSSPCSVHLSHQFTAPDLSTIARSLDDLEGNYDEDRRTGSTNMDDTGSFFVSPRGATELIRIIRQVSSPSKFLRGLYKSGV